jgi:sarcosine oxidase subunit beta
MCYTRPEVRRVPSSVVIVGGGVMGLSTAWHLRRADPRVETVLLERFHLGAAASAASAAGVRAMGRDAAERPLALASLARWPDLGRELGHETGYRRGGGLRVALDEPAWRAAAGWVAEQRADGVPVEVVDAAAAKDLAPGLAPAVLGGVYCPIDGQAEATTTVSGFAAAARRAGARIEEGVNAATPIVEDGRVVAIVDTGGARRPCDLLIVTGGAWSGPVLASLDVRLPIETRALQMLLTEPSPGTLAPVLGAFDRRLSFKQLAGGAYLIGGGWPADITDQAANRWTLRDDSVQSSLAVASEVYPPAAGLEVARSWAGLEAFTSDGLPMLGPVPRLTNVLVAAGFCGHGFALAPMVGDILARLALGLDAHAHLWRGLRADRFQETR